ncbi:TonB-dependent receptor [Kordiimonas sp. SCSIO 12603]|uniref:TonB-dependent receptor n=1 Tax=Kordiimonas sp. SCSIO 12603 TaxID=2829596 RepID=UPI00210702AC|nr:TonB-dependent receptor [Kordiimonas sp. SCSIO 12603]UTW59277.1 TonB-dependent receptor [Kordiimonas sp. SCSIO 12603]
MKLSRGQGTRSRLLASVALCASMATTTAVVAQDDDFELEEILVTSSKRTQTLQETPIAVSVTTAETFEKARLLDINDLQTVVPSLRVTTLQNSASTNFVIRGFGNGANNAGIEPSVGVFIDGVYRSRSAAQIGDLPRLERVEVLSGPQSTLFGKNASAGVISVVSAAPSYETEGRVELQYGNYDQVVARGYVTGGLSDTVAVSLSGGINKRDGYTESLVDGIDDLNDRDRWNIRGQVLFEPSENVSFRLIADYSKIDESCCTVTTIQNGPTAAAVQALGGALNDDTDPFSYTAPFNQPSINEVKDGGISLQGDVDFDTFTLTSITAYRSNKSFNDAEADYTGANIIDSANNDADIDTFTQEIRLTSTGDNVLDWMVGGFFFQEDITQIQGLEYGTDTRAYVDLLTGAPGTLATLEALSGSTPGSFFNADTTTRETFTQDNTAYSIFATVDYHITDRVTLTGGVNYTKDKKTVTGSTVNGDAFSAIDLFTVNNGLIPQAFFGQAFQGATGLAPTPENIAAIEAAAPGTSAAIQAGVNESITGLQALQFQPQFVAFPNSVEDGRTSDDKFTWTARVAYQVSDAVNVYASVATGFKASSWNLSRDSRPFPGDQAALEAAGLTQVNQNFGTRFAGPEESTVYELGLKARFARGHLNLALFDQTIKGFQSNAFTGTGFNLVNAGKQSTKGVELEFSYYLTDDFVVGFSGIYLDPLYDDFVGGLGPNGPTDLSGTRPLGIHEFSASTSATYNFEFDNGIYGYVRADWLYESDEPVGDRFPTITREVNTFNASAGITLENGVSLQIWGRNLFNDEYFFTAFPGVIQPGTINGYPSAPRTYGLTLAYEF